MAVNITTLLVLSCAWILGHFSYSLEMESAVKRPDVFQYGEDFDLFYRQFGTFAKILNIEQARRYNLLLSFLDKKSFNIIEGIVISDNEKLNIDDVLPKLKKALTVSKIPANIELRFRKQLYNETLHDFGYAIQCLGSSAYGLHCLKHSSVIDAFCMGVIDAGICAKLLSKDFKTLPDAISFATNIDSATRVLSFVEQNRKVIQQVPMTVIGTQPILNTNMGKQTRMLAEVSPTSDRECSKLEAQDYLEPERILSDSEIGKRVPITSFDNNLRIHRCYNCHNHLPTMSCFERMADYRQNNKVST